MIERKKIKMKKSQLWKIRDCFWQANDAAKNNERGIVLAQITEYGEAKVIFVPNEYAKRIIEITKEYDENN